MDLPIAETQLTRLTLEQVKGLMPSIQSLWDEVDQRNKSMRLDPDFDIYAELEDLNRWFFYLARYEDSNSFYSFFVQPSLHVKGTKQLVPDFIYVDPSHRGKGIADILLLSAEHIAKEEGATHFSATMKSFQKHDELMDRIGYTLYEQTFQKVI